MPVLLRLTDARLQRLGWRLDQGKRFTVTIPERMLSLRTSELCLITGSYPLKWEDESWHEDGPVPDLHAPPALRVLALGRVRPSPRPSTTDDRVKVLESRLIDEVFFDELVAAVPRAAHRKALRAGSREPAAKLEGDCGEAVVEALLRLKPELEGDVGYLRRQEAGETVVGPAASTLVMQRDAVLLAVSVAGIEGVSVDWVGSDVSYLDGIRYDPREESYISSDAARFPNLRPLPTDRLDSVVFTDGRQHIRITNTSMTPLESTLGVDLVYHNIDFDAFVLVQYKRMKKNTRGEWMYRPDKQFRKEFQQMMRIDGADRVPASPEAEDWRLHPRACYLKLVREPDVFDPSSDRLLSGIFLPIEYLDVLLRSGRATGRRGSPVLSYETTDRYLTSDLFVALVRQGWVGASGAATKALELLVDTALRRGRAVVLAEETGEQSSAERRRRPVRG